MGKTAGSKLLLLFMLLYGSMAFAQSTLPGQGGTLPTTPKSVKDTSKTNTGKWKNEDARITYEKLNSAHTYIPDTSIHSFHRQQLLQPWYRDLGNLGSPANNLLFTPEDRLGPTLGYHVFDVYRFDVDSLKFYSTTRPYSAFGYQLGSKLEQLASIMHTQNILPNWNFAVDYRKITSPGFYKLERNNHDNGNFTTNYKSLNKHYVLYGAMVYNKQQHDENGGIADSELADGYHGDRKTLDVPFQNDGYSTNRSSVTNTLRNFTVMLQHSYTWGRTDTTYSDDSTSYSYQLIPRFSITHKMELSTEKHTYQDMTPDSLRYSGLFNHAFASTANGYYAAGADSVLTQQKWFWVDNKLLLNGFIGKAENQLKFSAGLGTRYDQFTSLPITKVVSSPQVTVYLPDQDKSSFVSNYLEGEIKKEALHGGEWEYGANTKLFFTGEYAGNLLLQAILGRELKNGAGSFVAGAQQQVDAAPYNFTNYENRFVKLFYHFNNESVTMLYATLESKKLRLSGGVKNFVMGNYIYLDEHESPAQYTVPFTVTQAWARKIFKMGNIYLDNELVYQNIPVNAPVNIPGFMGRHQLSYEKSLFNGALKSVVGIEIRYNTTYHYAGYDAILNRFYYQNTSYKSNKPDQSVFFNFRIKRFRAFIILDNLGQLTARNTILFSGSPMAGTNFTPLYAAPDALVRFGFSWVLIN